MVKKIISLVILLVVLLALFMYVRPPAVSVRDLNFNYIIVDTPATRELGLSGRESLPENTAMLFVFDRPDRYSFWMKDMKFPIDIVWLDENFKIIHIQPNISPETYPKSFTPPQNSLYVLEFRAHVTEENHLKIGEVLKLSLQK